jgi:hypothetical protein
VARMMGEDVRYHSELDPDRHFVFLGKAAIYSPAGTTFMSFFAQSNRYLTRGTRLMVHKRKLNETLNIDGPLTTCVRLAGARDLQRTTAALDDAGERLSKLFLTQLSLNAGFGFIIGVGLWLIGLPSAPLWGLLAMILRFVPYIGAVISAIFPLVVPTGNQIRTY